VNAVGKVYLVGAGPGAPDLLTLRAASLLESADVVFYDALVNPEILALAGNAEKIAVGKRCGRHSTAQRFINKRLIDAAKQFGVVVRLKGGDPMLFGRAQEEIDALREAGIPFEVVPGVTAALAASAELAVSLTRRGVARSLTFATPRVGEAQPDNTWLEGALRTDTVAIYMGACEAASIAAQLIAGGKPASTPVVVVTDASLPTMRYRAATLAGLPDCAQELEGAPALILLGEVYREFLTRELSMHRTISKAAAA
jgi:uroporphyrin-III C-methyltransferase